MNTSATYSDRDSATPSPWVWPLIACAVVAAIILRVYPVAPNFTLVGALALFTGARVRSAAAFVPPLLVMLLSDLLLWQQYGMEPFNPIAYAAFFLYVALGRWLVAKRGVLGIVAGTLVGGMAFFLLTNGFEWWSRSVDPAQLPEGVAYLTYMEGSEYPYPRFEFARNLQGLCACYYVALPFYRNTLLSDGLFVTVLFGVHAVLARSIPGSVLAHKEQS